MLMAIRQFILRSMRHAHALAKLTPFCALMHHAQPHFRFALARIFSAGSLHSFAKE